jgi:DNA-directed RNA polymerase subunit RPC12/RpoP
MFKVRCSQCGAEFWLRGDFEPDTNAIEFGDEVDSGTACNCGADLSVIDETEL